MYVSDLGEFALIERLQRLIEQRQPRPVGPSTADSGMHRLLLGIGDDCAVYQSGSTVLFTTTDTMVQGVHFSLDTTSWRDLGWKALAVNLSDIAAMGAIPGHALITLGLPEDTPIEGLEELYEGLMDCATAHDTALAGGDIVSSPVLFITVSLMGRSGSIIPYPNNALLRRTAIPGDAIAVTGWVGSSAAGLRLLQQNDQRPELAFALEAHRRPMPRLTVGQLALEVGLRCGMDVSDGLVGDLLKICEASGRSALLALDRLPVRDEVKSAFPQDWPQLALGGGEDYELLLIGPLEVVDAVQERTDVLVTLIGQVEPEPAGEVRVIDEQGNPVELKGIGWDHLTRK